MSKADELKAKNENLFERNTILLNENERLKKENAELNNQLTKAKVVLRNVIDYLGQFCSDYPDCVIEAEQFLKEIK